VSSCSDDGRLFQAVGSALENTKMNVLQTSDVPFVSSTADGAQTRTLTKVKVKYTRIAVRSLVCHAATGTHMPYRITQCYQPPDGGDIPAFTPAEAGTQATPEAELAVVK